MFKVFGLIIFIGIVGSAGVIAFWLNYEPEVGPAFVTVEVGDKQNVDNIVVSFSVSYAKLHGAGHLYSENQVTSSNKKIIFNKRKVEHSPYQYVVRVCHPLYSCIDKMFYDKDIDKEINFGTIRLISLEKMMKDNTTTIRDKQNILEIHLINMRYSYSPNISLYEIKDRKKYRSYLEKTCREIYTGHHNADKCDHILF